MELRLPWMTPRLELLSMAIWDTIGVIIAQNLYILRNAGVFIKPGKITLGVAVVFLVISYVTGRYSRVSSIDYKSIIGNTGIAALGTIAIAGLASWGISGQQVELLLRGPVVELTVITGLWSLVGQWILRGRTRRAKTWLVVCTDEEWEELRLVRISDTVELIRVRSEKEINDENKRVRDISVAISRKGLEDAGVAATLDMAKARGATVRNIQWLAETHLQAIPSRMVDQTWLISSEGFGVVPGTMRWRLKRLVDISMASTLLIVTAPLTAVAMAAVWAEDRGNPLYKQIRTGLYGKTFTIWKIRSMKMNAECGQAKWSTADDNRVTRIGRVLRATRIDELPQLVNVLRGEMSMVGPRPERPEFDERFFKEIKNYRYRYNALPGLTGWSQVCFRYGASKRDAEVKLAYDVYYLKNGSLLLDFLIMVKTVRLVLSASGHKAMEGG